MSAERARAVPSEFHRRLFGTLDNGLESYLYFLSNENGIQVSVADFGATLCSLKVPDRDGKISDVVLGYDSLEQYARDTTYFGGTIGRYANRIRGGRFSIAGETFQLTRNEHGNQLHGGFRGFNKVLWRSEPNSTSNSATFRYESADGEEGYPGKLSVSVEFQLSSANELRIKYRATCDRETILNLTNHSYFNLHGSGKVLRHELTLFADRFTPVDHDKIPTGELLQVDGTPFDFRTPMTIGSRIHENDPQLLIAGGYDHNFVLNPTEGEHLSLAGRLEDPASGRIMEVWTSQPGLQLYSSNRLGPDEHGRGGSVYGQYSGLCLETQHFPDSPNHPQFPSTALLPGSEFSSTTIYKFGVT